MKTHLPSPRLELRMARLLSGLLLLLPALTSPLAAQTDPVEAVIVKAQVVEGPALADGQILLSSHSPDGPWVPCLDRTFPGPGVGPVLVRTTSLNPVEYFMSAAGHWFMDDFDDGYRRDWTLLYDPMFEDSLTLETRGGRLRITHGSEAAWYRSVVLGRTNLVFADFSLSIDIVDWEYSPEDQPNHLLVVLAARADAPHLGTLSYLGGVTLKSSSYPASIWIWEVQAGRFLVPYVSLPSVDQEHDYRLTFSGVGPRLEVQLFDLSDDPTRAVATVTATNATVLETGLVGFYAAQGMGGARLPLDVTVDNFVAAGTTPAP
jgi:hypothetical protein